MERPSSTGAGPVLSRPGVGSTVLIPEAMRMSARDTRADDLANQKKNLPLNLSGWVRKRGRSFRVKYLRYMRLQNKFLSNHRNEVRQRHEGFVRIALVLSSGRPGCF